MIRVTAFSFSLFSFLFYEHSKAGKRTKDRDDCTPINTHKHTKQGQYMATEIKGTVYKIGDIDQITERFRKRELWLDVTKNTEYPEHICIESHQDNTAILDGLQVGQSVVTQCFITGRIGRDGDRCWNTIKLWKVEVDSQEQTPTPPPAAPQQQQAAPATEEQDEIPF
jgi:hypothetical protein